MLADDSFYAVDLPKATFQPTAAIAQPTTSPAAFDFNNLAQTLLQIGGNEETRTAAAKAVAADRQRTKSHRSSILSPNRRRPEHSQNTQQRESLPDGMQMLCSVAWNSVHSPTPNKSLSSQRVDSYRSRFNDHQDEKTPSYTPGHTPTIKSPTPRAFPSPLSPPQRTPSNTSKSSVTHHLLSPGHRFGTQLLSSDEEDGNGGNNTDGNDTARSSDDETEPAEYDDVLNEPPERMTHSRSPHASLVDLTRAGQQMQGFAWQSPVKSPSKSPPPPSNPFPHSPATFTTRGQRSMDKRDGDTLRRKTRTFFVQQPHDFALNEPDEEEAEDTDSMRDILPANGAGAVSAQLIPHTSAHRNLELEYEHLQHALHSLQRAYDEDLATEVRGRIKELDVALALAVGVEPSAQSIQQLKAAGIPVPSSSFNAPANGGMTLLERSRAYAAQANVRQLAADLAEAHLKHVTSVAQGLQSMCAKEASVHSTLSQKMREMESKTSDILHQNHSAVTQYRDKEMKAWEKKKAAAAAAEAERLRLIEEARKAKEAAEAKAELEKKQIAEAEAKAKALAADKLQAAATAAAQAKLASQAQAAPPVSGGPVQAVPSPAAAQEMQARMEKLKACRAAYGAWAVNPAMKQRKMAIMMEINRQVAQVVGTVQQVRSKATFIGQLLSGARNNGQEEYAFCLDMLATKIVSFTKSKVRLQNSAAFPLAMVALLMSMEHPMFTDIFLASLAEKCTYITPLYLAAKSYPNTHAYMLALGYEEQPPDESKQVEGKPTQPTVDTEEQYFERMVGYVCMYAAFCERDVPNHPHGLPNAWVWLARVLNQKPRSATASILHAFLSTAGHGLYGKYPNQMRKILHFINTDYLLRLDASTPPRKAAQAVLALWLQNTLHQIQQTGRLQEPEGKNMPQTQESDAAQQQVHEGD